MLDTIKLFTPDHNMVDLGYIERKYGEVTPLQVGDEYYSLTKQISNFQLKYDSYGVHLEGSAPRFIRGNNINTLRFYETERFITELSESVGFDISQMKITRLDITDNLHMERTPYAYKRYFGKCQYFQRTDYNHGGLMYFNNNRKLLVYDKLTEANRKGSVIPDSMVGRNLLRFEYAILKRRKEHLGEEIVTLEDLLNPINFLTLIDKWEAMFHKIQKISYQSQVNMPYKPGMKLKDLFCLRGTVMSGGMSNSITEIDELMALEHITRRQSDHLKKSIIQYQNRYNELANEPYDLKQELIDKFNKKVEENRRMV